MDRHPTRREVLREFIKAYRRYSELWNTSHKDYNNRSKKAHSYAKLVEILKAIEPNATRDTVVKQINSLRSNFRKELLKMRNARQACASTDEDEKYTPSLWYYNDFLFLADCCTKGQKSAVAVEEFQVGKQEEESICSNEMSYSSRYKYVDVQAEALLNTKRQRKSTSAEQPQHHQLKQQQRQMLTFNRPSDGSNKLSSYMAMCLGKEDDEFLLLAKNYAIKLRKMEPLQRLFADRIINEVLLEGQLGTLDRYSSIANPATNNKNSQSVIFEKGE